MNRTLLILLVLGLAACKTRTVQVAETPPPLPAPTQSDWVEPSAVEHAAQGTLLIGRVEEVLPPQETEARLPCGETSCQARVLVQELKRLGNGPASRLRVERTALFQFEYTLAAATAGYFPELRIKYPGLTVGDRFEAVVDGVPGRGSEYRYIVRHYVKL